MPSNRSALRRIPGYAISIAGHAAIFVALWWMPLVITVTNTPALPKVNLEKRQIIWYPTRIPEIDPAKNSAKTDSTSRTRPPTTRTIRSTTPEAQPAKQMIFRPEPAPIVKQDVPTPEVVAFSAPAPRAQPREFVPPTQPASTRQSPPANQIVDAPSVNVGSQPVPASGIASANGMLSGLRAPSRKFAPPPQTNAGPVTSGPLTLDGPPDIPGDAVVSVVSVGLEPKSLVPLPAGALPAEVASGPAPNTGKDQIAGKGNVVAPGVVIRNELPARQPGVPQSTPEERAKAAARATVSAPMRPSSRILPPTVERTFATQTVYVSTLSLPADAARHKDPAMWFTLRGGGSPLLVRAPVLVRAEFPEAQVMPKGQRVQVRIVIDVAGLVVSASAPNIDRSLLEKILLWEFAPAMRNREPVEIDGIMEIEF